MSENESQDYLRYRDMPDIYNSGSGGQKYGWRIRNGEKQFHYGIDFGVSGLKGVPIGVPAQFDGWYVYVRENNYLDNMGNEIFLVSPDGSSVARFSHVANDSFSHLKDGEQVHTGDWIGDVGGTGASRDKNDYALHVHFEYGKNPKAVDVDIFVKPDGTEIEVDYPTILFDRQNPTNILTEEQLTYATRLAVTSKERVLSGMTLQEARVNPLQQTDEEKKSETFFEWIKTSWFGRLFGLSHVSIPNSDQNKIVPQMNEISNNNHENMVDMIYKNSKQVVDTHLNEAITILDNNRVERD